MTATITATDEAVALVDRHLASIPPGRELISVDEHTDVLLDIRTTLTKETP